MKYKRLLLLLIAFIFGCDDDPEYRLPTYTPPKFDYDFDIPDLPDLSGINFELPEPVGQDDVPEANPEADEVMQKAEASEAQLKEVYSIHLTVESSKEIDSLSWSTNEILYNWSFSATALFPSIEAFTKLFPEDTEAHHTEMRDAAWSFALMYLDFEKHEEYLKNKDVEKYGSLLTKMKVVGKHVTQLSLNNVGSASFEAINNIRNSKVSLKPAVEYSQFQLFEIPENDFEVEAFKAALPTSIAICNDYEEFLKHQKTFKVEDHYFTLSKSFCSSQVVKAIRLAFYKTPLAELKSDEIVSRVKDYNASISELAYEHSLTVLDSNGFDYALINGEFEYTPIVRETWEKRQYHQFYTRLAYPFGKGRFNLPPALQEDKIEAAFYKAVLENGHRVLLFHREATANLISFTEDDDKLNELISRMTVVDRDLDNFPVDHFAEGETLHNAQNNLGDDPFQFVPNVEDLYPEIGSRETEVDTN